MSHTCQQCRRAFPSNELFQSAEGQLLCADCGGPPQTRLQKLGPWAVAALALGSLPFFFRITSSSQVTVNGEVTQSVYRDYVALSGGVAAAIAGAVAIVVALKADSEKKARLVVAAAAVGLGLLQLLRGVGF